MDNNRRPKKYKRYLQPGSSKRIPSSTWYRDIKEAEKEVNESSVSHSHHTDESSSEKDDMPTVEQCDLVDDYMKDIGSNLENSEANDTSLHSEEDQFEVNNSDDGNLENTSAKKDNEIKKVVESLFDEIHDEEENNVPFTESDMEDDFFMSSDDTSIREDSENDDQLYKNCFSSIEDIVKNNTVKNPIQTPVDVTPGEIILMILKYAITHALSLIEITDLFKLINCIFSFDILPNTKYLIDKLFYEKNRTELHATCTNCTAYIGKYNRKMKFVQCSVCKTQINTKDYKYKDFFVTMDPFSHISKLIESNSSYYKYVVNDRVYEKGFIRDIYDGKLYRDFVKNLSEDDRCKYATTTFNTDGAPLFTSSAYSIWPIYLMVNELPFDVRTKNLILVGLWFGKDKPDMNVFLKPFVEKMNSLSTAGVKCNLEGEEVSIKIFTQLACVDSVARAPLMGFVQFNGSYGCPQCLHPGEWVPNESKNEKKKRSGCIKYVLRKKIPVKRDNEKTIAHMKKAVKLGKPVCGVKNSSQLINLQFFNFIKGCVFDSMHCIPGVAKLFATVWFGNNAKSGIIPKSEIETIDKAMKTIKVPHQVCRLTRPFSERAFWKAREWENWVLFYSCPILQNILPDDLFRHWTLFVDAIYNLMKDEIATREIDRADSLLHEFVGQTQTLYCKACMTFNIHILLHLAQSVYDWGPLWAHNAFAFESGNGELLKVIHAAKGIHHQICRQISLKYCMLFLKENLYPNCSFKVKDYYNHIGTVHVKKSLQMNDIRYFGSACSVKEQWINSLCISENAVSYKKIVKNSCLYMSAEKSNERSDNTFAILHSGIYVKLINFIVDHITSNEYVVVKKIITVNFIDENCKMLQKIVKIDSENSVFATEEISKVCVHIKLDNDCEYLCVVPNLYHY
ncbi:uncharacterized protein LOC127279572 [Leptopilina boulardi]|uniref:uncharacterized protein LOC127279572 n=1 Tax=Leptopilina boulardi TaxID=63433 RepID=UPI0021F67782|nr:uncharacterized protein LOC127279572 [Leptopilina boulardi]XP_051157957.1 uncharacterized protein LOC127279572 [Leptopilina boulardi]